MQPHLLSQLLSRLGWFVGLIAITSAFATAQQSPISLHYKPADHVLGDVHPYFKDGECFLYYLKPRTYDVSLVHSRDLINWTPATLIHQQETEDAWMRPYYVLGVLHDHSSNIYRSFYGYRKGQIVSSSSGDLLHWSCGPKEISIAVSDYYERRRDPYVFWIEDSKSYGCVMTTWMKGMPHDKGGAISLATSKDLTTWIDCGPIVYPNNIGEPECPQMFKLGNYWYLLASIYEQAVGRPVYWRSKSPTGPWSSQAMALDGKDLCAAQVAYNNQSLMLFGWVPLKPSQPGNQTWGGHMALLREVFALDDGKLGVKLAEPINDVLDRLHYTGLKDIDNLATESFTQLDGNWSKLSLRFNLQLNDTSDALVIRCEPLGNIEIDRKQIRLLDSSGQLWSEQDIELSSSFGASVQIVIDEDIIEAFVDDTYSLVARVPIAEGRIKLAFAKSAGNPKLNSISVTDW